MCGILGFIRMNPNNQKLFEFDNLSAALVETSKRGMGATGFFTPSSLTIKDGVNAEIFVKTHKKELKAALREPVFIAHCRAATLGIHHKAAPASDNTNNHPHESDKFALVHNGFFDHLPLVKGYKYRGNCDSELALSYLDTFGVRKGLELMSEDDTFSLVFYDKKEEAVWFYRRTNPLVYTFDPTTETLIFGSTVDIVVALSDRADDPWNTGLATCYQSVSSNEQVLFRVKPGEKIKSYGEIRLRRFDHELQNLERSLKEALDLEDFFPQSRYLGSSYPAMGSRNQQLSLYPRRDEEEVVHVRRAGSGLAHQHMPGQIFALIDGGKVMFTSPLKYAGDKTRAFSLTH